MTLRSECPGLNPDAVVTGGDLTRQRGLIQQLPAGDAAAFEHARCAE
jgi:hypothetical protein